MNASRHEELAARALMVLACIGAVVALALSGCATARLAETQCGAKGELKAAGAQAAAVEASALVCEATGQGTLESCEEAGGATLAARAVANSPAEVADVLRCAGALLADMAHDKAVAGDGGP